MQGQVPALLIADLCDLSSLDLLIFPSVKWDHKVSIPPGLA